MTVSPAPVLRTGGTQWNTGHSTVSRTQWDTVGDSQSSRLLIRESFVVLAAIPHDDARSFFGERLNERELEGAARSGPTFHVTLADELLNCRDLAVLLAGDALQN